MRKIVKISALALAAVLAAVIIFACVIVLAPWTGVGAPDGGDYSGWMAQNVKNSARLVDIAMPGAHDAFSYTLTNKSPIEGRTDGIMAAPFISWLGKNMFTRISKTQTESVGKLLRGGVRYIDIRLTYYEGDWHIMHNYVGAKFSEVLPEVEEFLRQNAGEVLIFDFQHVNDSREQNGGAGLRALGEITQILQNCGILKYAHNFSGGSLSSVTYGGLTANGTKSAVVMLIKVKTDDARFLYYNDSIRSTWFNSKSDQTVLEGIAGEVQYINANAAEKDKLRVMQAVVTLGDLGGIMSRYSIVSAAKKFNPKLVSQDDFAKYLEALPIVMTDCSITSRGDFNRILMEKIIEFNRK